MVVFDNTISNIIVEIAHKNELELDKTSKIVSGLWNTVKDIIQNEEPGVVKLDFFGKFIYSERYKQKKESIILETILNQNNHE